eukprot:TRINITY_DN737_c0_g2_i1.p1 TRINITY_DN737_c0_g2~~TRINITY_DN737_c0_g2_i1.p1  ORF type:complete len:719 (+),score=160.01 TRINITY_DN737_c0_g2_i1:372-2528(+)
MTDSRLEPPPHIRQAGSELVLFLTNDFQSTPRVRYFVDDAKVDACVSSIINVTSSYIQGTKGDRTDILLYLLEQFQSYVVAWIGSILNTGVTTIDVLEQAQAFLYSQWKAIVAQLLTQLLTPPQPMTVLFPRDPFDGPPGISRPRSRPRPPHELRSSASSFSPEYTSKGDFQGVRYPDVAAGTVPSLEDSLHFAPMVSSVIPSSSETFGVQSALRRGSDPFEGDVMSDSIIRKTSSEGRAFKVSQVLPRLVGFCMRVCIVESLSDVLKCVDEVTQKEAPPRARFLVGDETGVITLLISKPQGDEFHFTSGDVLTLRSCETIVHTPMTSSREHLQVLVRDWRTIQVEDVTTRSVDCPLPKHVAGPGYLSPTLVRPSVLVDFVTIPLAFVDDRLSVLLVQKRETPAFRTLMCALKAQKGPPDASPSSPSSGGGSVGGLGIGGGIGIGIGIGIGSGVGSAGSVMGNSPRDSSTSPRESLKTSADEIQLLLRMMTDEEVECLARKKKDPSIVSLAKNEITRRKSLRRPRRGLDGVGGGSGSGSGGKAVYNNYWHLPVGSVEYGHGRMETEMEACRRSLWEKTGIPSERCHFIGSLSFALQRSPQDGRLSVQTVQQSGDLGQTLRTGSSSSESIGSGRSGSSEDMKFLVFDHYACAFCPDGKAAVSAKDAARGRRDSGQVHWFPLFEGHRLLSAHYRMHARALDRLVMDLSTSGLKQFLESDR